MNKKKLVVKDFSKKNLNENFDEEICSCVTYNLNLKTKTLKRGLGINQLTVPTTFSANSEEILLNTEGLGLERINKVLYFKQYFSDSDVSRHRILVHGSDNKLYAHQMYTGGGNLLSAYQLEFESAPICLSYKLNGKDAIILSSPEKMVVWTTDLAPYTVQNVPIITSMCISNEVLFCTIKGEANKIWYCLTLNPELIGTSTETTKYLSLDDERGYARKVLTFKENLYAFRDYGITRINFYSASEISTTQVYLSDSKIYADTVTSCGDVIMFMTRDGIYSFNGVTVKKENIGIEKYLTHDNTCAVGACLQDKWYLGLCLNFDDDKQILCENEEFVNNCLLVINLDDFSFEVMRGVDIKHMIPLKTDTLEKMLVTFNSGEKSKIGQIDESGKLFGNSTPKFYGSNPFYDKDLGQMVIRNIVANGSEGLNINIKTNDGNHEFVTKKTGTNRFQTIIPCETFNIEISADTEDVNLKYLEIEYYKR